MFGVDSQESTSKQHRGNVQGNIYVQYYILLDTWVNKLNFQMQICELEARVSTCRERESNCRQHVLNLEQQKLELQRSKVREH